MIGKNSLQLEEVAYLVCPDGFYMAPRIWSVVLSYEFLAESIADVSMNLPGLGGRSLYAVVGCLLDSCQVLDRFGRSGVGRGGRPRAERCGGSRGGV